MSLLNKVDSNRWLKNSLQTNNTSDCSNSIHIAQRTTTRRELENVYIGDTSALLDVLMPIDDALDPEDADMDVADHEVERLFYECLKVTVRVNLSEFTLRKLSY